MKAEEITKAAIIGAGTMGAGMGLCFAQAGYRVVLYDVSDGQLALAERRIRNSQEVLVRESVITPLQAAEARARVSFTEDLSQALAQSDFVLEAAPENLELKHDLYRRMDAACPPEVVLASNTSGLSITRIASVCRHPQRVGGMHWVNPPELVPLVEVIQGEQTSEETLNLIYALAQKLGKVPTLIRKDVPGFGLNRLQFAVLREALHLVENGVLSPEDVDKTMKCGLGFRYSWLGPLETADLGGLDVFHSVSSYLFGELSAAQRPSEWFGNLVAQGKLGIKAGRGFYEYAAKDRDEILRKRDTYFVRQWKLIREVAAGKTKE